jgi:gliding motility-associated-like protein
MVSQTIIVDTLPTATINARPFICQGQTELISLSDYTMSTDSFFWDFGSGRTTHYSTDQGPYGVIWDNAGKMLISLKMKNKTCFNTVTDTVVVRARPDASFKADGYEQGAQICSGDSILMTPNKLEINSEYSWTPSRFFDNYSKQPVTHARIDFSGFVKLNVVDAYGCMNADSMYMNTKPCCDVYLPSAFSPNGDGTNDYFRIVPTYIRSPKGVERNIDVRSLKVINRWGQVVFETADDKGGWDGNLGGKPQDAGTYFYYINFKCDGRTFEQKGEVVLVR